MRVEYQGKPVVFDKAKPQHAFIESTRPFLVLRRNESNNIDGAEHSILPGKALASPTDYTLRALLSFAIVSINVENATTLNWLPPAPDAGYDSYLRFSQRPLRTAALPPRGPTGVRQPRSHERRDQRRNLGCAPAEGSVDSGQSPSQHHDVGFGVNADVVPESAAGAQSSQKLLRGKRVVPLEGTTSPCMHISDIDAKNKDPGPAN